MSDKLKVGIVGAGPIAQAGHFEACRRAKNVELYAICDLADDLLEHAAVLHQPEKLYKFYSDMLEDENVDAVIIAVSDAYHVPLTTQTILAGKPVLVEKPLGTSLTEVVELEELVNATGVKLQVGHMKRFDEGIAFAQKFIQEEIGELLALKAWYCDSTYRYTVTDNVQPIIRKSDSAQKPEGDPKADKAQYYMLAHGSHLVDTARFLAGEMVSCQARLVEKFGAYNWFVDVEFANGANGHLDLTVAVRMDWHEGFQIYGEYGSVLGKTYNPWLLKSSDVQCFSVKDNQYHQPIGADGHSYRLQVESFADSILNDKPIQGATIEDGVASVRAMLAIAESVKTGERVNLADVTGSI